jgi:hypothetical protein
MEEKTAADYNKEEKKVFALLSLHGSQRVVGSGALKDINYAADLDLMEYVSFSRDAEVYECVLDVFREKYRNAHATRTVWITDFKCGVLPGGQPIRWTRQTINAGHTFIEDRKVMFVDCLQQKSIIKMDIISLVDGLFTEFSEMYFINFGDFKTYDPEATKKENIETNLLLDVQSYEEKGNYFKALKRLFAYLRISEKDPTLMNSLINFFNSKVGELASYKSDLELVDMMMEQTFRPVEAEDIVHNLEYIEKNINPLFKDLVSSILDGKGGEILERLKGVQEILNDQIQDETKRFIYSTKKIYPYIKV